MRLSVAIASRGRPCALIGVVLSLWRLRSGLHEIGFILGVDEDDLPTHRACELLATDEAPVAARCEPRAPYLGRVQNALIRESPTADVVTLMSDRTFPLTIGWDAAIADAVTKYPQRVLWWSCPTDPDTTIPIIPRAVLRAINNQWSPCLFSYWYDDTWRMEIDCMTHAAPALRVGSANYGGARAFTTRGRDFAFWATFFAATRPRRIYEARNLAATFGREWKEPTMEMLEHFRQRDRQLIARAPEFEKTFGDPSEPGPEYLEAKAKAETIIREMEEKAA